MDRSPVELRKRLGLTQEAFAQRMGVPFRTYQKIEAGVSKLRPVHTRAAENAALAVAVERRDKPLAPAGIAKTAEAFSAFRPWKLSMSHVPEETSSIDYSRSCGPLGSRKMIY